MPDTMSADPPEYNHLQIGNKKIYFLHESNSIIRDLLEFDLLNADSCVVSTFSWYSDERKIMSFRRFFQDLERIYPTKMSLLRENVIFCGNSQSEYMFIKQLMPITHGIFFNNAALLSEDVFRVGEPTRTFDAVMNAKPSIFKRHYLLGDITKWLLISYNIEEARRTPEFADITTNPCGHLALDIADYKVAGLLAQCHVGVILSEIEGACYASAEYLLAGLPVVSTKSLGGRDEFYCAANCVIVPPDSEAIMSAVRTLVERSRAGEVDAAAIRAGAIARMAGFRQTLSDAIAVCLGLPSSQVFAALRTAIGNSSKLWLYRSFWKGSSIPAATKRP